MSDLEQLHDYIAGMAANLTPAERQKLTRAMARYLRTSTVARIGRQQNPDGSPFAPRKREPIRSKKGRLKRRANAMFQKLRGRQFLREEATAGEASVGFANPQVSRIGWVHQLGVRDRVRRRADSPEVQYPARVLLGFSPEDEKRILELAFEHVEP